MNIPACYQAFLGILKVDLIIINKIYKNIGNTMGSILGTRCIVYDIRLKRNFNVNLKIYSIMVFFFHIFLYFKLFHMIDSTYLKNILCCSEPQDHSGLFVLLLNNI